MRSSVVKSAPHSELVQLDYIRSSISTFGFSKGTSRLFATSTRIAELIPNNMNTSIRHSTCPLDRD